MLLMFAVFDSLTKIQTVRGVPYTVFVNIGSGNKGFMKIMLGNVRSRNIGPGNKWFENIESGNKGFENKGFWKIGLGNVRSGNI